jgi:hypothetical protein
MVGVSWDRSVDRGDTVVKKWSWLLWLMLFVWVNVGLCAVQFQAASEGATTSAAAQSLTFSHTVSAGDDLVLFASFTTGCVTACPAQDNGSATFNGDAMTLVHHVRTTATHGLWLFMLVNPDVATGDVVFTLGGGEANQHMAGGAVSFTGVDQESPTGMLDSDNVGSAMTLTCTVTGVTDGMVLGVGAKNDSTEAFGVPADERWNEFSSSGGVAVNRANGGSTEDVVGTHNFTFTSSANRAIKCIAVPINPAIEAAVNVSPLMILFGR